MNNIPQPTTYIEPQLKKEKNRGMIPKWLRCCWVDYGPKDHYIDPFKPRQVRSDLETYGAINIKTLASDLIEEMYG